MTCGIAGIVMAWVDIADVVGYCEYFGRACRELCNHRQHSSSDSILARSFIFKTKKNNLFLFEIFVQF